MWPYEVHVGEAKDVYWMHTGWFGNEFLTYFTVPEVLSAATGMPIENATQLQSVCIYREMEYEAALTDISGELQPIPETETP